MSPEPVPPKPGPRVRWGSLVFGALLLFVFWRLDELFHYGARFGPVLTGVSAEEAVFWVSHLLLALPGCALAGYALAPVLAAPVRGLVAAFEALDGRGRAVAAGLYGVGLFALAHVGRTLVLQDLPITDDENGILFGARMVLEGDLKVPLLTPLGAYNDLFTYVRDGFVSSTDYPGGIFFRAASLLLGGAWLYALAAAAAGVAVVATSHRLAGMRGALVAALVWLASPMVLALSYSTHAHVASRCFTAVAVYFAARLLAPRDGEGASRSAVGLGLFAGLAFLVRPIEVGMLLAPLGALFVVRAVRGQPGARRVVLLAVAGLVPALVFFAWYNAQTTGHPLVQARFGPGLTNAGKDIPWGTVWGTAIPGNFSFEVLMLSLWFLGPLGAAFSWLGVTRDRPLSLALAAGLGLALTITLAHPFTGIHAVGPIHFSETPVVLTPLAVFGMSRLFERLQALQLPRAPWAAGLLVTVLAGYALFDGFHSRTLRRQSEVQAWPFEELERAGVHNAVVLADPPGKMHPFHPTGSWVLQFPHPDPYFREDLIFANATADVDALRQRFPQRRLYRFRIATSPLKVTIEPIPGLGAPEAVPGPATPPAP